MHPGFVPSNHPNQVKKRGVDDSIDDRETPPCVFDPLNAEFSFTLDVASNHHNAKCPIYCTLKGLYADIAGRIVALHEEDEAGWGMSALDWFEAAQRLRGIQSTPEALAPPVACAPTHLHVGGRHYTGWDVGAAPVRHPVVREPVPPIPGDSFGQHEGLLSEGAPGGTLHAWPSPDDALGGEARRTGLEVSWAGHSVYDNPPFSGLMPWMEKHWDEGGCPLSVILLPANRQEQPFWQRHVEPFRDKPGSILTTRFLAKRRPFLHMGQGIGNRTSKSPPFGLVVCIWDRRDPRAR